MTDVDLKNTLSQIRMGVQDIVNIWGSNVLMNAQSELGSFPFCIAYIPWPFFKNEQDQIVLKDSLNLMGLDVSIHEDWDRRATVVMLKRISKLDCWAQDINHPRFGAKPEGISVEGRMRRLCCDILTSFLCVEDFQTLLRYARPKIVTDMLHIDHDTCLAFFEQIRSSLTTLGVEYEVVEREVPPGHHYFYRDIYLIGFNADWNYDWDQRDLLCVRL